MCSIFFNEDDERSPYYSAELYR